jgi:hypothetical protein
MNARLYPLRPNPAGVAFSASTKRFNRARAGRRSGKTERAKRRGVEKGIILPDGARIGFFAPTRGQAKSIFWNDVKLMTEGLWAKKPNESVLTVYLVTGNELVVAGLDEPARVEGPPWDHFAIDEADDIKKGFWDEHLRPCLSERNGTADFTGVPNGFGFLYDIGLLAQQYPDEYGDFLWHSSEILSPEEIESVKRTMDPRTFRQEYEGAIEAATGRVYYAFDRNKNVMEPPKELADTVVLSVGMDFNVNPMTCCIFFETSLVTYVIDCIGIHTSNTQEMIDEIRHRYGDRVKYCYPDPTGRKGGTNAPVGVSDHSILRAAGLEVFCRGVSNVRDGINDLNSRLCSMTGERRLFIAPKAKKLIEALERHSYKDDSSQPDKSDGFDHYCDGLKYPINFLHPIRERPQWQQ